MSIRKTLFWLHLIIGCSAAIFIFLMSITGVALTYERQMIQMAERSDYPVPAKIFSPKLPMSEILAIAKTYPTKKTAQIVIENQPNAPIVVKDGRKKVAYLNPYNGEEISIPGQGTKLFLAKLRAFHRWLTFDGKFSETGRWINGIANVIFAVLIISGLYLWLPKRLNKRAIKQRLVLSGNYANKTARNSQWHNVFGFYMAPVFFVIVVTAFFFSFKWPGNTLKSYVSTEAVTLTKPVELSIDKIAPQLPIASQLSTLNTLYPYWKTIQFSMNSSLETKPMNSQLFKVDLGNGGEPQKRISVVLNTITGKLLQEQKFEQLSTYNKLRSYIRFTHTGEAFGLVGQTIAGLASLLACLLVYTGAMLSWRRWINSRKIKTGTPAYVK